MFADSVLCYCTDNVTVDKQIRVYPNQKPWMTREVQRLLRERNIAFRSGDQTLYSAAQANLKRGIKGAKSDYRRRIEEHLKSNNSRQVWQGVRYLTNYRSTLGAAAGAATLAEELNIFFARFDHTTPQGPQQLHPRKA